MTVIWVPSASPLVVPDRATGCASVTVGAGAMVMATGPLGHWADELATLKRTAAPPESYTNNVTSLAPAFHCCAVVLPPPSVAVEPAVLA